MPNATSNFIVLTESDIPRAALERCKPVKLRRRSLYSLDLVVCVPFNFIDLNFIESFKSEPRHRSDFHEGTPKYNNNIIINILDQIYATVYTRVQAECMYKSNPIFEAKNTTFLEKV